MGEAALAAVPPAPTLAEGRREAARSFRQIGIATADLDARLLLCHAAGLSHEDLAADPGRVLGQNAKSRFDVFVRRRLEGEPVSRILAVREFYGRPFAIDEAVLDPRPDTETLIAAALGIVERNGWCNTPIRVLDLGTGTGCILITLLAELPSAHGVATDASLAALAVAQDNAQALGVAGRATFVAGDWLEPMAGAFDLIVANPPYLTSAEMAGISREVRHDPFHALFGGGDGLDAYRCIAARAQLALRPGGTILLETGAGQADAVLDLLSSAGLTVAPERCVWRDLAGRPRCVAASAAPRQPVAAGGV
jgi:release factor glutamine methyltransferase